MAQQTVVLNDLRGGANIVIVDYPLLCAMQIMPAECFLAALNFVEEAKQDANIKFIAILYDGEKMAVMGD